MPDSRPIWFSLFVLAVFCLGGAGGFFVGRHAPPGPFFAGARVRRTSEALRSGRAWAAAAAAVVRALLSVADPAVRRRCRPTSSIASSRSSSSTRRSRTR